MFYNNSVNIRCDSRTDVKVSQNTFYGDMNSVGIYCRLPLEVFIKNNLFLDPLFENPDKMDFRLKSDSPILTTREGGARIGAMLVPD